MYGLFHGSSEGARLIVGIKYPAVRHGEIVPKAAAEGLYGRGTHVTPAWCVVCFRSYDATRDRGYSRGVQQRADADGMRMGGPMPMYCSGACSRWMTAARRHHGEHAWAPCVVCGVEFLYRRTRVKGGNLAAPPLLCPPPWQPGQTKFVSQLPSPCRADPRAKSLVAKALRSRMPANAVERRRASETKRRAHRAKEREAWLADCRWYRNWATANEEAQRIMVAREYDGARAIAEGRVRKVAEAFNHIVTCAQARIEAGRLAGNKPERRCQDKAWQAVHRQSVVIFATGTGRLGEWENVQAEAGPRRAEALEWARRVREANL
jgi:hypothetical protein